MRKGIAVALWLGIGIVSAAHANYDGVDSYEEYGQRIQASQTVSPLSDGIFGDSVSLYNGQTTFEVTDVSIPGNSALPVALSRRLAIVDHRQMPVNGDGLHGFSDWDFDVPYIEGTFTQQDGWTLYSQTPGSTARCSDNTDYPYTSVTTPEGPEFAPYAEIWGGNHLHIPGQGDQDLLANSQSKSPAYASRATYKWVTTGNWRLSCIGSVTNLSGEGFVAISPSGVSYTFNYAATIPTSTYAFQYDPKVGPAGVARVHIYLLATQVKDRFGNWVKYNYSYDAQSGLTELTGITASDGRSITVNWTGGQITSVTSALGTWQYAYGTASWTNELGVQYTWPYLSSVTRPDGSKWTYSVVSGALITNKEDWPDDHHLQPPYCQTTAGPGLPDSGSFNYQIGAPSGATGTFSFEYGRHFRNKVPLGCGGLDSYPQHVYDFFDNFSLTSKQISGPGLVTANWSYSYGDGAGSYYTPTTSYQWDNVEPYIPPGSCSSCGSIKTVTVTGPTSVTKYTYGTVYAENEGQLLDTEVDDLSGNVLKTVTNAYVGDDDAPNEPFPNIAGQDLLPKYQNPMGNRVRPVVSTQIAQDGATFTTDVNSFDAFARSTSETESSSLGYSKTNVTGYQDDLSLWVLGMTTSTTVNGIVASQTDYTSLDQPFHSYAFGKLVSTKTWHPADGTDQAGTLASVTDGDTNSTTLSNWYRGIPRNIRYADSTSQSAVVNDAGWITSVTDENLYTTGYQYDPMGRLAEIDYPASDDVNWSPTYISFVPVSTSEWGIPAGHWKQTVQTGNGKTVTMLDAFWRPLVTESLDTANVSGTLSQTVKRYDGGGRTVFVSYPMNNTGLNYATYNTGTHTSYDALNRVTEVDQDSELGTITTKTDYLSGFKTQVTNPRGYVTTTSYYAYGAPDTSQPHVISAPEGETTTIARDAFGKALSITRSGPYNGVTLSATRSYVYDANQQLCKRIDPESGARVMAYDDAGNLQWSASGLSLPSTTSCDTSTAYSSGRRVDRTYDERNRLKTVTYPDGFSNTSLTYTPDGLVKTEQVDNAGQPVNTTYDYDKRRLLTSESLSIPNSAPLVIGYGYDGNGHLSTVTYPDGRNISYLPNALGQPTQAGAYATGVSYYPNGAIRQFTYGDGTLHTMTQDERQLPDRVTDSYAGSAVLDDGRDYDANGNVAAITDYLSGNIGNRTMTYDGLDRLTQAVSPMFGGDNTAAYSYDPLDNMRSGKLGNYSSANYQYDAANRLSGLTDPVTGSSMVSYGYDVQGNITAKNNQTYQFDEANRLLGVPGVETYLYDAGGRRVQKTQVAGGTVINADYDKAGELMYRAVPSAMNVTDYIYLGGSLLARVTNNTSNVIGSIDGAPTADNATIGGWACSTGLTQSIIVELYIGATQSGGGTHVGTYTANAASEPAIAASCQSSGSNYRFSIPLDSATRAQYAGQAIYLYGDSPVGNNNNELNGSGQYTVPANPTPPDAPASVTVPSSSTTSSATVSWSASANTTDYVLQQSFNGDAWAQIYSGTATSYIAAVNNGSYQFQVQACNAVGCSAFTGSNTLSVAIIPAAPASVTAPSTNYTGSFAVSWSASSYASSYVLQQSANGGAWTQVYSGAGTTATVTVGASGNYQYRVQACGAGGCSGYRTSGTVVVTLKPATAPSLSSSASTSTSGTYTLSWSAVSGATRYQLNQKVNSGAWSAVYNSSGRSWSSNAVATGTYAYVVYACNVAGCSSASSQVTVTVHRVPDVPALTITPSPCCSSGQPFTVSWTAESGATSYNLKHTNADTGTSNIAYSGPNTSISITISGRVDSTHEYNVQACNSYGCSDWSATKGVYIVGSGGIQATPASAGSVSQ